MPNSECSAAPQRAAGPRLNNLEKYLGQTEVVTYQNRPVFSGTFANDAMAGVPDQVYTVVDRKLLVTLHLLMFNGRLTAMKTQSKEILDY